MNSPDQLTIGNVRFTAIDPARGVRGKSTAQFINTRVPTLSFSAAKVAEFPAMGTTARVKLFAAEATRNQAPAIAIFPCVAGVGTAFLNDGKTKGGPRRKIQGKALSILSAYRRVEFRVEAITSPGAGWLLTPTASERKAAP